MVASAELCMSVVADNGLPVISMVSLPVISLVSRVAGLGFAFLCSPRIVKMLSGNAKNVLITSILEFEIEVENLVFREVF